MSTPWSLARLEALAFTCVFGAAALLPACDDPPPKKNAFDPPADQPKQPPPAKAPEPEGPPSLVIDAIGPKVGFLRANIQFPDGKQKLTDELVKHRSAFEGKEVRLAVDRKAKPDWVELYLSELAKIGVSQVLVSTETRTEFPAELRFTPEAKVSNPPSCSVVAMILADRATAVWKLGGGVAGRRPKGMAGPDLTMTGETIERNAKACKQGSALFVAGAEGIEWGLVYDLAASTVALAGARFDSRVLLNETPVPGHKVALGK